MRSHSERAARVRMDKIRHGKIISRSVVLELDARVANENRSRRLFFQVSSWDLESLDPCCSSCQALMAEIVIVLWTRSPEAGERR